MKDKNAIEFTGSHKEDNTLELGMKDKNVCRCWLAMPLEAGFLSWVLACHTIEKKRKSSPLFLELLTGY